MRRQQVSSFSAPKEESLCWLGFTGGRFWNLGWKVLFLIVGILLYGWTLGLEWRNEVWMWASSRFGTKGSQPAGEVLGSDQRDGPRGGKQTDRLSWESGSGGLNLALLSALPSGRVLMFAVDRLNALTLWMRRNGHQSFTVNTILYLHVEQKTVLRYITLTFYYFAYDCTFQGTTFSISFRRIIFPSHMFEITL